MFSGSIVAIVTPMHDDGGLDLARFKALIDWHIAEGTDGIVVVGTTGESPTVDFDEHKDLIRVAVEHAKGRIPVIAGTGANSTSEAIELTESAKKSGASACLSVVPYYNKPTQEGLYRHFRTIAEAVDAPQIVYNVPGRTVADIGNDTVLRLAQVPNITGLKDATGNLERGADLLRRVPKGFSVYSGDDATGLPLMLLGGHGVISVTANVAPRLMHEMCAAALALVIAGCGGSLFEGTKVEYKSAGKLPSLEVPPDLTSPTRDDRYQIPDVSPTGTATLSTYNAERGGAARAGATEVLPAVDRVRIERAGTQRWLVVPETPEKIWPVVKEFWQELGFLIKLEIPEAGVMETDWAENRAKIPQDFIRNTIGKLIEGAYSTSERDKFRTRLERGKDPGTTEIYISHRGVAEVYTDLKQDKTVWQPRPSDPELEAEFLRRLMVRFGVEDSKARSQLAADKRIERAKLVRTQAGSGVLELSEPFDRAWRRVGLALDRVGFTVEDRDRSNGTYFVRYVDPEKDAQSKGKNEGLLSRLMFWRSKDDTRSAEQYRVQVKDAQNDSAQVLVLNKEGVADTSETAGKILSLLHDQLK